MERSKRNVSQKYDPIHEGLQLSTSDSIRRNLLTIEHFVCYNDAIFRFRSALGTIE